MQQAPRLDWSARNFCHRRAGGGGGGKGGEGAATLFFIFAVNLALHHLSGERHL